MRCIHLCLWYVFISLEKKQKANTRARSKRIQKNILQRGGCTQGPPWNWSPTVFPPLSSLPWVPPPCQFRAERSSVRLASVLPLCAPHVASWCPYSHCPHRVPHLPSSASLLLTVPSVTCSHCKSYRCFSKRDPSLCCLQPVGGRNARTVGSWMPWDAWLTVLAAAGLLSRGGQCPGSAADASGSTGLVSVQWKEWTAGKSITYLAPWSTARTSPAPTPHRLHQLGTPTLGQLDTECHFPHPCLPLAELTL